MKFLKHNKIIITVLIVVLLGALYFINTNTSTPVELNPNVTINSPKVNALVSSPLTVTGEASGWYFEGSFPVTLLDANGKILVQFYATAQGDWMTSDFVPFISKLTFPKPTTDTGTLVLMKDNPSGLPENDESVSIPVRFK